MAIGAELHGRDACAGLCGDGPMAECAIHAESLHGLTRRVGVRAKSSVDGV